MRRQRSGMGLILATMGIAFALALWPLPEYLTPFRPNWMALAPLPITATRLPARSTAVSQRAEWKAGPAKLSRPSISGSLGRLSWPQAVTKASAVRREPSAREIDQMPAVSSLAAPTTSAPRRMWPASSCRSTTPSM